MWQEAVQADGDGTRLLLEVTPGAKTPQFPAGFNQWRGRISVKVRPQPQGGRANEAVLEAVSAIGPCTIIAGASDSRKTVRIERPRQEVLDWLQSRM
ncbi:MAG: DUF167 domain-containing protein [Thermoplasmatota archaeon]